MYPRIIAEAVGLFAITNFDDIVILALFFGRGEGERGAARRVVAGQYLAFIAILAIAIGIAYGAGFLPRRAIAYLGLLPIGIGLWEAWKLRKHRAEDRNREANTGEGSPAILKVAATTFGNGGDNIGVYVPVFTTVSTGATIIYAAVFLVLVGVWCAAGRFFATRPVIARALSRWGHLVLPVVLVAVGVFILVEGGAFGL
jgi:cadmium resistance protein CadD (predicted permease)